MANRPPLTFAEVEANVVTRLIREAVDRHDPTVEIRVLELLGVPEAEFLVMSARSAVDAERNYTNR